MSKKSTKEIFIDKSRKRHGDKYNYDSVVYQNAITTVIITCKIHGDFQQTPNSHLNGAGCRKCHNDKLGNLKRHSVDDFVESAKLVHGDKYDYSDVAYEGSKKKVKINCPIHGTFEQIPSSHLMGRGCRICGGTSKKTTESFISDAMKIHGDLYDYNNTKYLLDHSKVFITCKLHGDFEQEPSNHLQGNGCPRCAKNQTYPIEEFLRRANIKHSSKYSYFNATYKTLNDKITITCCRHGDFPQRVADHLNGKGCPSCAEKGFNPTKASVVYLIKIGEGILGFGISNSFKSRYVTHKTNFKKHNIPHELLQTFNCSGHQALAIENHLKQTYEVIDTGIEGFRKEATEIRHLPTILTDINKRLDNINETDIIR